MSNVLDIESLRKEFLAKQTTQDLQKFAEKQQLLLEEYIAKCKDLQDKISHLEEMLKHAPSACISFSGIVSTFFTTSTLSSNF